jgi:S1-C subfamily serine protease
MYQYGSQEPAPQAQPPQRPPRTGRGRTATSAILALALTGMAVGGGAVGATIGANRADDQRSASTTTAANQNTPLTAQPLQSGSAQAQTVASQVYQRVGGAVVEVQTAGESGRGMTPQGGGSGVVIDASGLILTNNHVVQGASSVSVLFDGGAERDAEVLGTDAGNDLALLRVENMPEDVPVASLGDSDAVQVGEIAIAVGSPFGLEGTVTQGIVSAIGRDYQGGYNGTIRDLIQTDAPINPGNSGGGLFNSRGELIGITTLNESPVRGSVGVGFAVPINTLRAELERLRAGETIERAWLGISGYELDEESARELDLDVTEGVLVTSVVEGGPADEAGIQGGRRQTDPREIPEGGDVITAIDGNAVAGVGDIADALAAKRPGQTARLTVVRDGEERQVTVTLEAWPEQMPTQGEFPMPQPQP